MSALGRATAPPQTQVGVVTNSLCFMPTNAEHNQHKIACEPPGASRGLSLAISGKLFPHNSFRCQFPVRLSAPLSASR
jgi:hypothetical protein